MRPLHVLFPRMFRIMSNKDFSVSVCDEVRKMSCFGSVLW